MIKFEEHDGLIFKMLDKPVPLTPEAEMPCLVRLIQNDSPMGRYNRDAAYFDVIDKLFVAQKIKENPFYSNTLHAYEKNSLNQDYCIASIHTLEIIGYPVVEGSHWWALYSAMNGKSFVHKDAKQCRIFTMFSERELRVSDGEGETVEYVEIDEFLNDAAKDGWQIYKEPEQKPAKEQFEVGDWVEYRLDGDTYYGKICNIRGYVYYLSVTTEEIPKDQARAIMLESIIRKIFPREVIVHIGCLSGTVEDLSYASDGRFWLIGKATERCQQGMFALLYDEMLDTPTSNLVESLLKAQKVKK